MKYITLHETTSEYNQVKDSLAKPQVAYISETNKVEYQPYVDPSGGHQYVEIGGKKWATMNVGASSVTDAGLYFQWGDTVGYTAAQVGTDKQFTDLDYKYGPLDWGDENYGMTKYNYTDHKAVLEASDDAVHAAWGGNWRIPTTAEFAALGTATTSAWTADYEGSGVAGIVLTSTADSSKKLFFPAVGYAYDRNMNYVGSGGNYWTSSLNNEEIFYAYQFQLGNWGIVSGNSAYRHYGCPLRGILDV